MDYSNWKADQIFFQIYEPFYHAMSCFAEGLKNQEQRHNLLEGIYHDAKVFGYHNLAKKNRPVSLKGVTKYHMFLLENQEYTDFVHNLIDVVANLDDEFMQAHLLRCLEVSACFRGSYYLVRDIKQVHNITFSDSPPQELADLLEIYDTEGKPRMLRRFINDTFNLDIPPDIIKAQIGTRPCRICFA